MTPLQNRIAECLKLTRVLENEVVRHVLEDCLLSLSPGPTREAEIRADEARQILFALDRYEHASDYGPPIQERIEQHERAATVSGLSTSKEKS